MASSSKRTKDLWVFVEDELTNAGTETVLPRPLLLGLRSAVESGLSCDQIAAMLLLQSGVHMVKDTMSWSVLLDRVSSLMKVMETSLRKNG